jgi:hypothetical protein
MRHHDLYPYDQESQQPPEITMLITYASMISRSVSLEEDDRHVGPTRQRRNVWLMKL